MKTPTLFTRIIDDLTMMIAEPVGKVLFVTLVSVCILAFIVPLFITIAYAAEKTVKAVRDKDGQKEIYQKEAAAALREGGKRIYQRFVTCLMLAVLFCIISLR